MLWDRKQSIGFIKGFLFIPCKVKEYLEIMALFSEVCWVFSLLNGCGLRLAISHLVIKVRWQRCHAHCTEQRWWEEGGMIYFPILLYSKKKVKIHAAAAKSLQSCPTLCDPIDGSQPGSAVPGILQARTLEWVAISFSNAGKWKVKVKSLHGNLQK